MKIARIEKKSLPGEGLQPEHRRKCSQWRLESLTTGALWLKTTEVVTTSAAPPNFQTRPELELGAEATTLPQGSQPAGG